MRTTLKARLTRLEAKRSSHGKISVGEILDGYRTGRTQPEPWPTRAELEAQAKLEAHGEWRGRIAEARLRAGLYREAREGAAP